jgi:hypothetical protein
MMTFKVLANKLRTEAVAQPKSCHCEFPIESGRSRLGTLNYRHCERSL